MSRSVSQPSSVTNTSPCWNGFIVPGSTFRYGSSFCMVTRSPRALSSRPRLDAVRPLPRLDATPPVTKRCLVCARRDASKGSSPVVGPRRRSRRSTGHQYIGQRPSTAASPPSWLAGPARRALQGGVRARLAFRLPDVPPLRGCQTLLVGLPEPGQGDRADDGEAE